MKKKKGAGTVYNSTDRHYMSLKYLRSGVFVFLFLSLLCFSAGCGKKENKNLFNSFTVVSINDVPEDLKSTIKRKYKNSFELTYSTDESGMYIVKGYGRQEAAECNITVEDFYYSDDDLVVDTNLSVSELNDSVSATPTYPYIIIKPGHIEDNEMEDKQVYEAGIYIREILLANSAIKIQIFLDERNVTSVEIIEEDTVMSAMYPLIEPSIKRISEELSAGKSVDEYTFSESSYYTEKILLDAISEILQEHKIADTP